MKVCKKTDNKIHYRDKIAEHIKPGIKPRDNV